MKGLASFVKEKRKLAGLTQEEFADRVGVALTVIRKIEKSFLPDTAKENYRSIVNQRYTQLGL